jgi:acetyl-CoA carboxylase carboxyltransferase component
MGPQGAVKILHHKELSVAQDPTALQAELSQAYSEKFASPFLAAGEGHLDDIILPSETRVRIIQALHTFKDKRVPTPNRKHGNIPL